MTTGKQNELQERSNKIELSSGNNTSSIYKNRTYAINLIALIMVITIIIVTVLGVSASFECSSQQLLRIG